MSKSRRQQFYTRRKLLVLDLFTILILSQNIWSSMMMATVMWLRLGKSSEVFMMSGWTLFFKSHMWLKAKAGAFIASPSAQHGFSVALGAQMDLVRNAIGGAAVVIWSAKEQSDTWREH
mmetsp:Transcript_5729/g.10811  ORF Transcript_5729/g.10811 Transcript_5729/m.10811 type:complete len:119 (+) Transcript_5729:1098-1454(+)